MATNGILKFQGTNKATFVGATSNVVIDTVKSSLGIGVDVDGPTSNLHVVGNAYVSTELTVGGTVTAAAFAGNASTASALATPVNIGGVAFDGSAAIVPTTFTAATFSGDVTVASSKFSFDTNGTSKQEALNGNGRYIKLMKYFGAASNWKIATGSYAANAWQWINMRVKVARLDGDVKTIQFNFLGTGGIYHVTEPMIIGTSANNEVKVYVNTTTLTYEIYIQTDSASSVEVEISHRNSTIDDDYSTVAVGVIVETGLTKIYDSSTTTDFIVKSGNVGIGTTNPAQKLHVSKVTSGGVTSLLVSNPNGAINASAALKLGVSAEDNNVAKFGIIHERKSTYGGGDTYFCTNYATDTTEVSESDMAMTILGSNKNVGIGTTSPLSELDLYKATGGAELLINTGDLVPPTIRLWNIDHNNYNNHAAGTSVGTINFSGNERLNGDTHTDDTRAFSYANTLYDWARISALFVGSTSTSTSQGYVRGDLAFYTNNGNASASDLQERMRIKHNGNVGIGTTDPSSTLEVHGTGIHMQGTVLRALSAIGTVASGAYVKLCDFSALSASSDGVCAITIRWGSGTGGGTYYYWQGHAAGIVSFNTYSDGAGTFNSSGSEPLTLNHHYHYRTVGPLTFIIDSDNANASYGRHSIYVAPNAAIDSMSFEVIALPLRR